MKKLIAGVIAAGVLAANPITSHAALGDNTLKPHTENTDVQTLQKKLKSEGFFTYGHTTKYYGTYTKAAVKRLQQKHGLKADGITGLQVFKALDVFSKPGVVKTAKKYTGTPYQWGGTTPKAFDCSGYVKYVFNKATNVNLPRTVSAMHEEGSRVSSPAVGDLVFFNTSGSGPSHVGIYIGSNKFIQSSTSHGVTTTSMSNSYWKERYIGAKRYR